MKKKTIVSYGAVIRKDATDIWPVIVAKKFGYAGAVRNWIQRTFSEGSHLISIVEFYEDGSWDVLKV